jgi:secretion/DNA translocation related CpaE-like protein
MSSERPLVVTADPDVLDDLLRLAATAGVDIDVAPDAGVARRSRASAPFVVVGPDAVDRCARGRLPRRASVALLGRDLDDAGIWQDAVAIGAEHVIFLPDAEGWLVEAFSDAAEGTPGEGVLVAVLGGCGGAGATSLACALAVSAVRGGRQALLVDGDPLGGGIDLVFGGEQEAGLRWPDLGATRGRVPAAALALALPRLQDLSVLSWDRGEAAVVPAEAMQAVLAAGRRTNELVVVDLPRHLDEAAREVLAQATTTLLVLPAEVRAAAAAARVAAATGVVCRDMRVIVRGPGPSGLAAAEIDRALGLPLAGVLRPEPGLDLALERGEPPGRKQRSPLGILCDVLLADLLPEVRGRAA